jgi:hypothetical protein
MRRPGRFASFFQPPWPSRLGLPARPNHAASRRLSCNTAAADAAASCSPQSKHWRVAADGRPTPSPCRLLSAMAWISKGPMEVGRGNHWRGAI